MPSIMFDTHIFVKKLISVGFSEIQAEALAEEQGKLIEDKLATKQDVWLLREDMEAFKIAIRQEIENFKIELRQEMESFKVELRQEMESFKKDIHHELTSFKQEFSHSMKELELRMTIKLGSMLVIALGIFTTIIKVF